MNVFAGLAGFGASIVLASLAVGAEFPVDEAAAEDAPASTVAGNPFTVAAG